MAPVFERGPDEEGIETRSASPLFTDEEFERGPDEEGIETPLPKACFSPLLFERGPDEEGIETTTPRASTWYSPSFERGPDEEGIETTGRNMASPKQSSNADLMKKGLRRGSGRPPSPASFERGPDEEGIETFGQRRSKRSIAVRTRT